MTVRAANVKGIKFMEEPRGANRQGTVLVTFDLINTPYTGGSDCITLGGGGTENGVATTLTLAQMIQNRRRDGRTVTLTQAMGGPAPGRQLAASANGPDLYTQTVGITSNNVTGVTLLSAGTGGSAVTTTTGAWDAAATVVVSYAAVYPSNNPE